LNEAGTRGIAFETERLSRDAETEFDLGANHDPSDVSTDGVEKKIIALVRAVETDFCAVETGADPELEGLGRAFLGLQVRGVGHG